MSTVLIRGEHAPQASTTAIDRGVPETGDEGVQPSRKQPSFSRTTPSPWDRLDSRLKIPPSGKVDDGGSHYLNSFRSSGPYEPNPLSDDGRGEGAFTSVSKPGVAWQPKQDRRTIVLKNLCDRITHKDVVTVVRGGSLLDVYLRPQDRSASVSFVESTAAEEFLAYVKRNDVYIHGRRISFSWSDRQFYMPNHVASKIGRGATRNLVLRDVNPSITEQRLREDLDHIHNLIIISVSFIAGDVYLSLNSVHNSLFARTCMMSRATYKGMRIEWYPDDCALPLPKVQNAARKDNIPSPKPKATLMLNRFQLLNTDDDDTEEDSSLAGDEDLTMSTGFSSLQASRRTPWDAPTAVA
ncbi:MAG: hypothetical protein LQ352_003532 [Teloschistes flavicans]|nr:MAG: hypothetical protein LQ352_003532 [Teloschistes flavicans]